MAEDDGRQPAAGLVPGLPDVGPAATLRSFLASVLGRAAEHESVPTPAAGSRPLLTVVLRTQGRRPETLRDALLCLQAQTDDDFDLVVAVHAAPPAAAADVDRAVADLPREMHRRTTVLQTQRTGRASPLNDGFQAARGRYVAFLDDDDLVLGDWVAQFAALAAAEPGRVLRTVCVQQAVDVETWAPGRAGVRSVGPLVSRYPARFELVDHLLLNRTPFMAYAFPRELFHTLGLRFDESLDICEDWDFALQAVLLVGAASSPAVTAIYRRWLASDSSATLHTADEWRRNEAAVIARLDARPQLWPPGSISQLRATVGRPRIPGTHDAPGAEEWLETIDRLEATLAEYEASRSWRLTRPLRALTVAASRWRRG
jgi:glycosyltransferase involved in cell wall biosynthesis